MRQNVLPTGACPHEGREYELMACARKRLALFGDQIPERFVNNPLELALGRLHEPRLRCTVYYMPGDRSDAALLLRLVQVAASQEFDEQIHRQIGKLLSYKNSEIERFITYVKEFNARKLPLPC